ncbi:MAG TPA: NAD-dependent succinate-semialdehyde dehydrogenase [Polyangia bacterium]|jgi:succinate-semialdehyde dehydrogenase/glutarate-semialdehyde dehydrogenase|nr:NAD-dependent succinate-semialdehyde dehydrogenase [Polyangia bacterium]
MAIASVNPATGETVRVFEAIDDDELERRLQRAARAFESWRQRTLDDRCLMLRRAAELLEQETSTFARLCTTEMGKPLTAAEQEVQKCAAGCRYYAAQADRILAPQVVREGSGVLERIELQPLGVVLAVMPWNFPYWQVIRFAAPALAAGNVALLKHASNVPQCALALEDLFRRAGAPDGVFQTLLVGARAVERIIADDRVAAVTLTGSEDAGRQVAAAAGKHIKKSVLELGGSDPFIVLPSADLDAAVETAVKARTVNTGQSCIAAKRFIVAAGVYDQFVPRFVAAMQALRVGDPLSPDTQIGPLASAAGVEAIEDQVARSVRAGARLLTGGKRIGTRGNFFAPTVLGDVPPDAPVAREETFGPVAAVFRVPSLESAIALANNTSFGLGAAAFTRERSEAERLARELAAGSVFINSMVVSDPQFPFGGVKHSGYGRELADVGMREFVNLKTVRMAGL